MYWSDKINHLFRKKRYQRWDVCECYKLWVDELITNLLPEPLAGWVILLRVHLCEPSQISITEIPGPHRPRNPTVRLKQEPRSVNHRSDYHIKVLSS